MQKILNEIPDLNQKTGVGRLTLFLKAMRRAMEDLPNDDVRDRTTNRRVARRYSVREAAEFLDVDATYLSQLIKDDEFPEGEKEKRERRFSVSDIMRMRAMLASRTGARKKFLHWRTPGEDGRPNTDLPVVSFSSQKGGTAKTVSAAHFAQYLSLFYGLRVGVVDADPQATISLYFAGEPHEVHYYEGPNLTDFMGISWKDNNAEYKPKSGDELDKMWSDTPWPGIRLMHGSGAILEADIGLMLIAGEAPVYRVMLDAVERWKEANAPKTTAKDLRDVDGNFDEEAYQRALRETLDIIIIDHQPSLTLTQVNCVFAATNLVVPQTMKSLDLSTLELYLNTIQSYLELSTEKDKKMRDVGSGNHFVLPTLLPPSTSNYDKQHVYRIMEHGQDLILPVWCHRSDAFSNPADEYMSIYEYDPEPTRRKGAKLFMENVNAVNDAMVRRILEHLPARGYADSFVEKHFSDEEEQ
ncbi:AAA family ATPase [Sulfitobacter sp. R18_1]|uniref:AAA family ATPase n=1 Tax=Sulfitobacter sp. R18_1 TaxID=2821104 RepID=UPI001ADB726E|nr:AAA family ATPase [Sulfitobacter sp. R18_1]MBO9428423.1 AAA family ATPase [Sulfitobacter sp. R18_1]